MWVLAHTAWEFVGMLWVAVMPQTFFLFQTWWTFKLSKGLVDIYFSSFLAPLDEASYLTGDWLSAMGLWTLIMSHQFPPTLTSRFWLIETCQCWLQVPLPISLGCTGLSLPSENWIRYATYTRWHRAWDGQGGGGPSFSVKKQNICEKHCLSLKRYSKESAFQFTVLLSFHLINASWIPSSLTVL